MISTEMAIFPSQSQGQDASVELQPSNAAEGPVGDGKLCNVQEGMSSYIATGTA